MLVALVAGAFVSTLLGGLIALRARDRLHLVLGLAAGVMLGVVVLDLLPEALELSDHELFGVPGVMLTTLGGFFTVHVLERAIAIHRGHESEFRGHSHGPDPRGGHSHHRATEHAGHGHLGAAGQERPGGAGRQKLGLLAGSGLVLHSLLDGVGIGLGMQAGEAVGIAVAIAVIAHDFADGFNTFTITTLYGNARRRALTLLFLDALAPVAGAAIGWAVTVPADAVGLYLGYFAGFLLYLATADILPEAHARHPSRLTLACTVAGAGFMWLVVGLTH